MVRVRRLGMNTPGIPRGACKSFMNWMLEWGKSSADMCEQINMTYSMHSWMEVIIILGPYGVDRWQ